MGMQEHVDRLREHWATKLGSAVIGIVSVVAALAGWVDDITRWAYPVPLLVVLTSGLVAALIRASRLQEDHRNGILALEMNHEADIARLESDRRELEAECSAAKARSQELQETIEKVKGVVRGLRVEKVQLAAEIKMLKSIPRPADVQLFKRFLKLLPSGKGDMPFIRVHHWNTTFSPLKLTSIDAFVDRWTTAMDKFHDLEVETRRIELYTALENFLDHLWQHAFERDDRPGEYRIYPDVDLDVELEHNKREIAAALEADDLSMKAWAAHQEFVMTGRRRLNL